MQAQLIGRQKVKQLALLITRAWDDDAMRVLGGWLELAGIDPVRTFGCKAVKHPLIGQAFRVGDVVITVKRCITHPRGRIMFDVQFSRLCPAVLGTGVELRFAPAVAVSAERLTAEELAELADLDAIPRPTAEAVRRYREFDAA